MTIEPVDSVRVIERMEIAAKAEEKAPQSAKQRAEEAPCSSRARRRKNVRRGHRMIEDADEADAVAVQR